MTDRIRAMLDHFIVSKDHHKAYRQPETDPYEQAYLWKKAGLTDLQRSVHRLRYVLERETPVVFRDERIALLRTVRTIPEIFTPEEWESIRKMHTIHEQGKVCNINPDYMRLISTGFAAERELLQVRLTLCGENADTQGEAFLQAALEMLDIVEAFAGRYREAALAAGNAEAAAVLEHIPARGARTLAEGLQFFRLLHYCLWCCFNYHLTIGRFDQYMLPLFQADRKAGRLTPESALELLEEFFISCNRDSDLYPGMQQGDNGQSLVLGGTAPDGGDCYNELSALCLQASLELKLIDPKINLRVSRQSPLARYQEGTQLTRQGLGFPQYSNDDVVIQALEEWGYDREDAYDYCMAACWEFIIPGKGMDIPNIGALSFPEVISSSMEHLPQCESFNGFLEVVEREIHRRAEELTGGFRNLYMEPSPLLSLMMDGCVERARDISLGGKYNNYGLHGPGLSTAADSLYAVKKHIFEDKDIDPVYLVQALEQDYEGEEALLSALRYDTEKMGSNDDRVDSLACWLVDVFAQSLKGKQNDRGGVFRAGTGSAMYYIFSGREAPATPDGRKAGEALAANFSPSLFSRCKGPVSIIQSFTKPALYKVANGGPLTIELHDTLFRSEDSVTKVAMYVKSYIDMGGHQMQINAVNRDRLIEAQKHPDQYRNLIVRVWGWSGYFVELDKMYQDHIIERMELTM